MAKTAKTRLSLTDRDILILSMVFDYGSCAIYHLLKRFWPDSTQRVGPKRSCYRRIQMLTDAGYLQTVRIPWTGTGGGRYLVILGSVGVSFIADYLKLDLSDVRNQMRRIDSPYVCAHQLAVCDFRLSLELAVEQQKEVKLTEWTNERTLRNPPLLKVKDPNPPNPNVTPPLIALVPDGEFVLTLADGSSQGFRLEVDLTGSTSPKRQRAKLRAYLDHAARDHPPVQKDGQPIRRDDRPVLWVSPTATKADLLASWCHAEAAAIKADETLFWITTRDLITSDTVLKAIWREVGGPLVALVPQPTELSLPQVEPRTIQNQIPGGTPWTTF